MPKAANTGKKAAKPAKQTTAKATADFTPEAGRRVTSYDVARYAGVSQSAVSRCFKEGGSVSPKTRDKIMKAVRKLGYQPNAIARGLITRRSNMVAVIIANLRFYPETLAYLTSGLNASGNHVLLFSLDHESEVDRIIDQIWQYGVDGVIAGAHLSKKQIELFDQRKIPLVFINRLYRDIAANSVCCDQVEGERILVDRLVAAGHRSFAVVTGPSDSVVSQQRISGAVERLADLGINDVRVIEGEYDYDSGRRALRELADGAGGLPQAVVCANDMMAIGCMDEARHQLGLRVPEDLSVVGFDGVMQAAWSSYDLVTVRQPMQNMVEAAVSMLLSRIERPDLAPEKRMFSGEIVEGCSARLGTSR